MRKYLTWRARAGRRDHSETVIVSTRSGTAAAASPARRRPDETETVDDKSGNSTPEAFVGDSIGNPVSVLDDLHEDEAADKVEDEAKPNNEAHHIAEAPVQGL